MDNDFIEGFAIVIINAKCGFINKFGKEVIPLKYDLVYNLNSGLARVDIYGKIGYIDKNGTEYWEN